MRLSSSYLMQQAMDREQERERERESPLVWLESSQWIRMEIAYQLAAAELWLATWHNECIESIGPYHYIMWH